MSLRRLLNDRQLQQLESIVEEYGGAKYQAWEWVSEQVPVVRWKQETLSGKTLVVEEWGPHPIPIEDVRIAGTRNGKPFYMYTPHTSRFAPSCPDFRTALSIFQACWRRGEPVTVRGLQAGIRWDPETMARATREPGNKAQGVAAAADPLLEVILCAENWVVEETTQNRFFKEYMDPDTENMKKVKDWPPKDSFKERLKRHNQDFLESLPLIEYTHPQSGENGRLYAPMNLATMLPPERNPTDLGPKTYVAFGRTAEDEEGEEGDSVTKLHQDMSDAVNIMWHSHYTEKDSKNIRVRCGEEMLDAERDPSYGNAGAVWDIWRREDRAGLRRYLQRHTPKFKHHGRMLRPQDVDDVIFSQCLMLTESHRQRLAAEEGVVGFHFEQHVDEAVFIPGGCPHQVRNLRSCIKAAVDFVSPESMSQALELAQSLRECPRHLEVEDVEERPFAEKLQAKLIMYHGCMTSYERLTKKKWDLPLAQGQGTRRNRAVRHKKSKQSSTDDE